MTGEQILKAVRLESKDYPHFAVSPITLLDAKKRVEQKETVEFAEPLFKDNPLEERSFLQFLSSFEKSPVDNLVFTITEKHVIIQHWDTDVIIFSRKLSPIEEILADLR